MNPLPLRYHSHRTTRFHQWVMRLLPVVIFLLALLAQPASLSAALAIADLDRKDPVDFQNEILPIFRKNCLACHGQKKPKGGLVLESPQTILKGGDSGEAVIPGKGAESYLLQAAAHEEEDTIMPPKGNKVNARNLTPQELALLKLWIDQGAKGEVTTASKINWNAMPQGLNAIYSVAITQDGQWAACGRANRIHIYRVPNRQPQGRLSDKTLVESGLYEEASFAHLDVVNALAFNPAGDRLASGGYREVKIWKRQTRSTPITLALDKDQDIQLLASSPGSPWLAGSGSKPGITLWHRKDGSRHKILKEGNDPVTGLALNADGSRLAVGLASKAIQLWDTQSGQLLVATNASADILSLAWSADGTALAVGCANHQIQVWAPPAQEGEAWKRLHELKDHKGPVTGLVTVYKDAQGKDQKLQVLSGSEDGSLLLWDLAKGSVIRKMDHGGPVAGVAVRADGTRFASAGKNNLSRLWNAADGKSLAELKGNRHAEEAVAQRDRAKSLASAHLAYQKSSLQAAEKEQKSQKDRTDKAVKAFEPADKAFAEKSKVHEAAGKTKAEKEKALVDLHADIKRVTEAFNKADQASKAAQDQAEKAVAAAGLAMAAQEQSLQTKAESASFVADANKLAARAKNAATMSGLKPEEKQVADKRAADAEAAAQSAKVLSESAERDAEARTKFAEAARTQANKAIEEVAKLAFAAGQTRVDYDRVNQGVAEKLKNATNAVNEATKKLGEAEGARKKAEMDRSKTETELNLARQAHAKSTNKVQSVQAALKQAEAGEKKAVADLEASRKVAETRRKPFRSISFSRDGLVVAAVTDDGMVQSWSAANGIPMDVHASPKPDHAIRQVAFLDEGCLLVAPSGSGAASPVLPFSEEWVLERVIGTGDEKSPLVDRVNSLAFSPDGKQLATGGGEPSRSGELKIWSVENGELIKDLPHVHSDTVLSVAYSPDGTHLASGATDKFARVTELKTGEVVRTFEGHTHHVMGVSWKQDGRTVATSGADKVVKIWDFVKGDRKKNVGGFEKEVTSIHFIGITDQAVVTAGDNKVQLVKEDGKVVRTFSGVTDFQHASAATPDGNLVLAGGELSILRVWNGNKGDVVINFPAPTTDKK